MSGRASATNGRGRQLMLLFAVLLMFGAAADGRAQAQGARAAVDRLEAELGRNPFDPVTLNNLAVMRAEQGDYHAAADLLERAMRLAPTNETLRANNEAIKAWKAEHGRRSPSVSQQQQRPAVRRELPPEPPPLWN